MGPLRAKFLARAAADLEALRGAGIPREAGTVIHRLAGAAGVFGFPELSRLAGVVDEALHAFGECDPSDMDRLMTELEAVALTAG